MSHYPPTTATPCSQRGENLVTTQQLIAELHAPYRRGGEGLKTDTAMLLAGLGWRLLGRENRGSKGRTMEAAFRDGEGGLGGGSGGSGYGTAGGGAGGMCWALV